MWLFVEVLILAFLCTNIDAASRWREEKSKCPSVRSVKSFDFQQVLTSSHLYLSDSHINGEKLKLFLARAKFAETNRLKFNKLTRL